MDFELDDALLTLQQTARRFAEEEIMPVAAAHDVTIIAGSRYNPPSVAPDDSILRKAVVQSNSCRDPTASTAT